MVFAQVLRRRGRSLAVVAAIVVAAVSFSLLTSAVATSRLEVQGTVEENFRSAYDILVRPPGSISSLEREQGLVQENYLAGIYGGITMEQYRDIAEMDGVEVAAPIAMVGYFLPALYLKYKITDLVSDERRQLFRIKRTWISDRGLSAHPTADKYVYVTGDRVEYGTQVTQRDPKTGEELQVCDSFRSNSGYAWSPFDLKNQTELTCFSTNPPTPSSYLRRGEVGTDVLYQFPVLFAAIDPVQEARLVGLDEAVVSGRYLRADDRTGKVKVSAGSNSLTYRSVPILMAERPLSDETLQIDVQRLDVGDPAALPGRLASEGAVRWLRSLDGRSVRTETMTDDEMYPRLLGAYANPKYRAKTQYWSAGPVEYRTGSDGHLIPVAQRNGPETWYEPLLGGYLAPPANADIGFRNLTVHEGSNAINRNNTFISPILRQVGVFDPDQIEGFSRLSQVPLTTYYPPSAAPGDARTKELLDGRGLAPNANLAGYIQQPPMLLTTLASLPSFANSNAFTHTKTLADTPISVIRVRVAGVTGADDLSQERVRLVAERIARQTGLDVDVTIGSSPTPQLIDLPAGEFGRPELTLREAWVQKGVAVRLLSAVDAKSLALFVLVLVVCLFFLLNATTAAVRMRRTELGTLACLGWPARRIFALLEVELLATGLLAGLLGTGLAAGLTAVLGLDIAVWQLVLITPVATLLAGVAGVGPAWRASHARPIEAITPAVRAPRRSAHVGSVTRLAMVGVTRWPGRTLLGAASLFIGVAALAVLIAIQTAFQGGVAGTLLGDVVAVQVRGVDYLAAGLTVGLGAFAVADIAYLNIAERTAEIGTFRASGWAERHVRRLFGTEAVLTAAAGAITGAGVGVTAVAVLFPIAWQTTLLAAAAAAGAGILAAITALTIPLSRLSHLAPATAITTE